MFLSFCEGAKWIFENLLKDIICLCLSFYIAVISTRRLYSVEL